MKAMLISLGAATAAAAAIVWAPIPGGGEGDAPVDGGSPPATAPATAPESVRASAAAAHLQFAAATVTDAPQGAAGAPPPKPAPGPPILVGLTDGSPQRFAYVLHDGQTTRAGLGDRVGRWHLTAIGAHGITLRSGRQTLELALYGPRPAPPPPAAEVDASSSPPPTSPPPTESASSPAPPAPPPRARALEPASAPSPHGTGHRPHYWVGPANQAPPGYIVVNPGQAPPTQ